MKTEQEIRAFLSDVLATPQLHMPSADIFTNAPLALIQVELETKRDVLEWVLGVKP